MRAGRLLRLVASTFMLVAAHAGAVTFEGVVTHVGDGDSLWVRPASGGAARPVRLEGIDAPELCQAGGEASRDALARRVLGQHVRVEADRRDDFDRWLARVERRGQDVATLQVRDGHAWSYRFRADRGRYVREEQAARQARRGLWREPHPVEPREFRRVHGSCR